MIKVKGSDRSGGQVSLCSIRVQVKAQNGAGALLIGLDVVGILRNGCGMAPATISK